jgi:DNA polymerase I-like protein with 3'-5' exonuclease and polymerase domains
VYDELDFADITSDKQIAEIKGIMENCVKLKIPLVTEVEVGPSWGQTELVK